MVEEVARAKPKVGLIATLAAKIKKQVVRSASLAVAKKAKKDQNIQLADQRPEPAKKEVVVRVGAKNPKRGKNNETNKKTIGVSNQGSNGRSKLQRKQIRRNALW